MAEQIIENIYKYSNIIYELEKIAEATKIWMDEVAVDNLDRIFPKLAEACHDCVNDNYILGKALWEQVEKLTGINGDLLALGDQIEYGILPILREFVHTIADINIDINDEFMLQSSVAGYLTLYSKKSNLYFHSRHDPMFQALQFVKSFYNPSKETYYVFGCGMGYELFQLYDISDGFTHIVLYEPDDVVFDMAYSYGVLSMIPDSFLKRYHFENVDEFLLRALADDAGILLNIPTVHNIDDENERRTLITYWMKQNTIRQYEGEESTNRIRNKMLSLPDAEEFLKAEYSEEVVVVAAGPSLNERIELLKKWKYSKKIIAVGTIFRKLLSEGIIPDYVVMIDPTRSMSEQLEGIEDIKVPLLFDENVYWKLPRVYKGPKFFMRSLNYSGTVASAAIEVATMMSPLSVYLVGLDLSYPNEKDHADGSAGIKGLNKDKLLPVDSIDGGLVLTDTAMKYYVDVIEKQVSNHLDIVFYNMSKHGVNIKGVLNYKE